MHNVWMCVNVGVQVNARSMGMFFTCTHASAYVCMYVCVLHCMNACTYVREYEHVTAPPGEVFVKLINSRKRVSWDIMASDVSLTIQRVNAAPMDTGAMPLIASLRFLRPSLRRMSPPIATSLAYMLKVHHLLYIQEIVHLPDHALRLLLPLPPHATSPLLLHSLCLPLSRSLSNTHFSFSRLFSRAQM